MQFWNNHLYLTIFCFLFKIISTQFVDQFTSGTILMPGGGELWKYTSNPSYYSSSYYSNSPTYNNNYGRGYTNYGNYGHYSSSYGVNRYNGYSNNMNRYNSYNMNRYNGYYNGKFIKQKI